MIMKEYQLRGTTQCSTEVPAAVRINFVHRPLWSWPLTFVVVANTGQGLCASIMTVDCNVGAVATILLAASQCGRAKLVSSVGRITPCYQLGRRSLSVGITLNLVLHCCQLCLLPPFAKILTDALQG